MYPRTEYEMTQEDLDAILEACKPVPYIIVGGHPPPSQQENANRAWASLGAKMGFDPMTVQPSRGGDRFFSAVPSETEEHKSARLLREAAKAKQDEINLLTEQIAFKQKKLDELRESDRSGILPTKEEDTAESAVPVIRHSPKEPT